MIKANGDSDEARLTKLLQANHPFIAIRTDEEHHAIELVRAVSKRLKLWMRAWTVSKGVYEAYHQVSKPVPDTEHPAAALTWLLQKNQENNLVVMLDLAPHLEEAKTRRLLRDLIQKMRESHGHVVLIDAAGELPGILAELSTRFNISPPCEKELNALVRKVLHREHKRLQAKVKVSSEAWNLIIRNLRGLTRRQAEQVILDAMAEDQAFTDEDLNTILARKRQLLHQDGVLEYVESPTSLDQIAGFARLKEWLKHREKSFSDEARKRGLKPPRGMLMLGVPGAGKSLCAKAVATAWQRPLLRLDPSVLYDKFIGESEQKLRTALGQAEAMAPIVLWIDEIEKGFAGAASKSVDGGLSQRMFGTLLTWMQEHQSPVFLIATANNIDALPAELLRKGRFDEIFFVGLPSAEIREAVFRVHLKKRDFKPEKFNLKRLAEASEGYTGSEIEQAVVAALHESFAKKSQMTTELVLKAIRGTRPLSVTMHEYVTRIRQWAKDRCVPVD
jgi:SpoVK/Ycf46/Vps4 family AAA+-type ATPase